MPDTLLYVLRSTDERDVLDRDSYQLCGSHVLRIFAISLVVQGSRGKASLPILSLVAVFCIYHLDCRGCEQYVLFMYTYLLIRCKTHLEEARWT